MENVESKETVVMDLWLNRFVYKSDYFSVVSMYEDKSYDSITVTGCVPELDKSLLYRVRALEKEDKKYGKQFEIVNIYPLVDLENEKKMKSFFDEIVTNKQFENIFDKYSIKEFINLLDNGKLEELTEIKGIGFKTAENILNKYEKNIKYLSFFSQLAKYNLNFNMIKKIYDSYKNSNEALECIKNNPYSLIYDVKGIGFDTAEKIAEKVGIKYDSVERMEGIIYHVLMQNSDLGNTYITQSQLLSDIIPFVSKVKDKSLLTNIIKKSLYNLEKKEKIIFTNERSRVSTMENFSLETKISNKLKEMMKSKSIVDVDIKDINKKIEEIQEEKHIQYTDEQKEAIKMSLTSNVMTLVGGAGTGKTTTLMGILGLFNKDDVAMCSLSGKAASRMSETTNFPSYTIHRLLVVKDGKFVYNEEKQLPNSIIIIDEVSMIGLNLFWDLIKSIKNGSKLVLIGDEGQLEAIGTGNLFKNVIESNLIPTVKLTKIHRQAQKSAIITKSWDIRNKVQIVESDYNGSQVFGELKDFILSCNDDSNKILNNAFYLYKGFYNKTNDIKKVQIVTPLKERGSISTKSFNTICQAYINPKDTNKKEITVGDKKSYILRVGDRVINKKNFYSRELMPNTDKSKYPMLKPNDKITDVFNGYQGILIDIVYSQTKKDEVESIVVDFDMCGIVSFSKEDIKNIELGYACTVHSFQGSQCDYVVFVFDFGAFTLLTKEMVYTGITRASKVCALCTNAEALRKATITSNVQKKQTYLKELLDKE